ncbi:glutathione S-transferase [Breoghania sp. L-A4]|uniref:glutathione S-transferase n=1 Tax=Breoghania sp. L-A4 TaxID=2304600 RepID=UPI000E3609E9|nr:glutathione S-transferase [Breoghania sp. L-A4]AXS39384.1 glutathione S-transferase [Breoghania sp. L-A4]
MDGDAHSDDARGSLRIQDCINAVCPWSGNPVDAESLTLYRGHVVGFCNTGCRDKFDAATGVFEAALAARGARGTGC